MTTQSNAFNSSDGSGNRRLALDNLIRRELKVGDPSNAGQIAQALMTRYSSNPRAQAIASEARGMPFLQTQALGPVTAPRKSATEGDLMEAMDDVNKDLQVLLDSNLLKDAVSELRGWAAGIRSVMSEAGPSARQAIDRQQRDKTFALRRQLGDYARMARLAGVLTPSANDDYRSLATSLDEAANVLLVVMGEALSENGLEAGGYIPEAPLSELEGRRSMVLAALRNLMGSVAPAQDQGTWPWGINAYGALLSRLNRDGQAELRSLLTEAELSRVMDGLVNRAGSGDGDGLRALGATAQIELTRMRRLVGYWPRIGTKSPAMANFLRALQLFVEAFDPSAGSRLLVIARPPILSYGISQRLQPGTPAANLQVLALRRAQFAADVDCFLACGCGDATQQRQQVILDKLLYDLDRSVDLYALGTGTVAGPVEWRGHGYSVLFRMFATDLQGAIPASSLFELANLTAVPAVNDPLTDPAERATILEAACAELCAQISAEQEWWRMVQVMVPSCGRQDALRTQLDSSGNGRTGLLQRALDALDPDHGCPPTRIRLPVDPATAATVDVYGTDEVW